jgi:glycosyltransferase involved in cell wall biosynthesis
VAREPQTRASRVTPDEAAASIPRRVLIAYDLRYAADHFTGIGTHAHALFAALLELPGDERYAVLWDPRLRNRRFDVRAFASHPRVVWHERAIDPLGPASPLQLGAWLRSVRPDAYLSPFYFAPIGAPCPALLTIHDVWPLRLPEGFSWPRRVFYRMSLQLARRARFIVTSSRFSRSEIIQLLPMPESRVRAIRLGVPPAPAVRDIRPPAAFGSQRFALVVGDNRPRKNLVTLARAWAALGNPPPLALVSAGPNDERYPSLARLATEVGGHDVHSLGWVDEPELAWLYRHAEMILFPSRYEGFGFPLVEAFVHGRPTIAADIPVLREIADGVTQFVPVDSATGWAQAVRAMADDPELRAARGHAGHVRARELSYPQTARETLDLVREAVGVSMPRQ